MENALAGKRVLITQATAFMGPVLCEVFAEQGAEVIASADDLAVVDAAERVVEIPLLQFPLWLAFAAGPVELMLEEDLY